MFAHVKLTVMMLAHPVVGGCLLAQKSPPPDDILYFRFCFRFQCTSIASKRNKPKKSHKER